MEKRVVFRSAWLPWALLAPQAIVIAVFFFWPAAQAILQSLQHHEDSNLLFPALRGKPLSDMTLTAVLRRMEVDAVPHGFRSTFRDWAGERTNYPREIAEQALAHAIENKVEAAYRRGDALDKRRVMMQDWEKFLISA